MCRQLQAHGIRTIVPITLPSWDLDWFDLADPERTPLGRGAVAWPASSSPPRSRPTGSGRAWARAAACYDRTLPLLPAGTPVIAVLHPGELTDEPLPCDAHDRPVDAVLTADGVTAVG